MSGKDPITSFRAFADEQAPEQRKLIHAACDAFVGFSENAGAALDLGPILIAARSKYTAVWNVGTELLVELASRDAEALSALLSLTRSAKVAERRAILASLDKRLPRDLVLDILRHCLADRSEPLRLKALERCADFEAKELQREMDEAAASLSDKHKSSAAWYRALAVEGHFVEVKGESAWVTIRVPTGYVSNPVSLDEIAADRLAETVARLRRSSAAV